MVTKLFDYDDIDLIGHGDDEDSWGPYSLTTDLTEYAGQRGFTTSPALGLRDAIKAQHADLAARLTFKCEDDNFEVDGERADLEAVVDIVNQLAGDL